MWVDPLLWNDAVREGKCGAARQRRQVHGVLRRQERFRDLPSSKLLVTDLGLPFCAMPLAADPDVKAFWDKWAGGGDVIAQQASSALKKDVIAPWFGEWNESASPAWQSVFLTRQRQKPRCAPWRPSGTSCAKANAHVSTVSVSALDRLGRRFGYDERSAAVLIFPVFIVLLAVAIFPIVYSFFTSLFDINLTRPWRRPFVGFDNYLRIFADPNFWVAVQRTTVYTVVTVSVTTVLAVAAALLLNEAFPGRRLLAALVLLPWATPSIVNGLMWKWISNPGYGLLNGLLVQVGLLIATRFGSATPTSRSS